MGSSQVINKCWLGRGTCWECWAHKGMLGWGVFMLSGPRASSLGRSLAVHQWQMHARLVLGCYSCRSFLGLCRVRFGLRGCSTTAPPLWPMRMPHGLHLTAGSAPGLSAVQLRGCWPSPVLLGTKAPSRGRGLETIPAGSLVHCLHTESLERKWKTAVQTILRRHQQEK